MGVTVGPQTAFCQDFQIEVRGRGGHAARPHLSVDPIAISAHLITLIYQAAPRSVDTRTPAVVTIGQIAAGHCANVIPDTAQIRGTIRTLDAAVSDETKSLIERLCAGTAEIFGAEIRPAFDRRFPGVVNDRQVTAICSRAARTVVGGGQVLEQSLPSMGAEDFADYLTLVPGCMVRLGAGKKEQAVTPLHTPTFDINEDALMLGARFLVRALFEWSD
jgi:amidohydrolase